MKEEIPTIEEQLASIEHTRRILYLAGLRKAAIVLDALGDKMDYTAKEECKALVESVRWAEKQLRG